jgi:hypothetical protein
MNGREAERSGAKEGNGAKVGEREGLDGIGRFLTSKLAAWTSWGSAPEGLDLAQRGIPSMPTSLLASA